MIANSYLQIASALHAKDAPEIASEIVAGKYPVAIELAKRRAEMRAEAAMPMLNMCGDLSLLLDLSEDAETYYHRAHRVSRHLADGRAWHCRATAMQSLLRGRLETAATCFYKLYSEDVPPSLHIESGLMAALIFRQTGPFALSWEILASLVRETKNSEFAGWRGLLRVIAEDFRTQSAIRTVGDLPDEIHWQVLSEERSFPAWIPERSQTEEGRACRLLDLREHQLRMMLLLAGGRMNTDCIGELLATIEPHFSANCREMLLLNYAHAAVAGRDPTIAKILIATLRQSPVTKPAMPPSHYRRQYLYCISRQKMMEARPEESFDYYREYAAASMHLAQEQQTILQRFDGEIRRRQTSASDAIGTCLPARYRRAYLYMLTNLHRANLTIAEVADSINVSERALQLAFKQHVNLSPREVLRRARVHKIREEIADGRVSLMDAARKFGVNSRAALAAAYRKNFDTSLSVTPTVH